jgi:hypothetical protein
MPTFDVDRFSTENFNEQVVKGRTPVCLRGANKLMDTSIFSAAWLFANYSKVQTDVRYQIVSEKDPTLYRILADDKKPLGWFLRKAADMHFNPKEDPEHRPSWDVQLGDTGRPDARFCLYAKDFSFTEHIPEWKAAVRFPTWIQPLGEESDLLSALPPSSRPVTLMAYLGSHLSRTPFHMDKVGTIAINVMLDGSKAEKHWWLVHHEDTPKLARAAFLYGGNLYNDKTWISPAYLASLGIRVWHCVQRVGDLIVVPPMVPHQVMNKGPGVSIAVACNVFSAQVAELALDCDKINRLRYVDSVYRVKATIYCGVLAQVQTTWLGGVPNVRRLQQLLPAYERLVQEEDLRPYGLLDSDTQAFDNARYLCDVCKTDIFNTCLICSCDKKGESCLQCYPAWCKRLHDGPGHQIKILRHLSFAQLSGVLARARDMCVSAPQL